MVVSCQICGKQFESFRSLNGHMNAHIPSHRKRAESYKPPSSAVKAAKKGLAQRKEWGRGGLSPSEAKAQGIDSGVTRARKIASGSVSRHDVRRMSAFNRHRKNNRPDKKMPDGGPTAGTIAWNLWGGSAGVNWAKKKSAAMNAESSEENFACTDYIIDEIKRIWYSPAQKDITYWAEHNMAGGGLGAYYDGLDLPDGSELGEDTTKDEYFERMFDIWLESFEEETWMYSDDDHGIMIQAWRVLYVPVGTPVNLDSLGNWENRKQDQYGVYGDKITSWLWQPEFYAGAIFGHDGIDHMIGVEGKDFDRIVLTAWIPWEAIDWASTIAFNISIFWQENELCVMDKEPVYEIGVSRNWADEENHDGDWKIDKAMNAETFDAETPHYEWEWDRTDFAPTELIKKRLKNAGFSMTSGGTTYKDQIVEFYEPQLVAPNGVVLEVCLSQNEEFKGFSRLTFFEQDHEDAGKTPDIDWNILHKTFLVSDPLLKGEDSVEQPQGDYYQVYWDGLYDEWKNGHNCADNAKFDIYFGNEIVMECEVCGRTATFRQETPYEGPRNAETFGAEELCDNCSGAGATIAGCTCGYMDYLKNAETLDYNSFTNDMESLLAKYSQMLLHYDTEYQSKARGGDGVMKMSVSFIPSDAYFDDVDFDAESASDPETPEIISYQKNKYSMDLVVEYRGRKHDVEIMIYQGYDAEEGQLAKALAAVREKSKRYAPTPLRLTKLPHPDQKTLKDFEAENTDKIKSVISDIRNYPQLDSFTDEQLLLMGLDCLALRSANETAFEADWRDLSRDSSGRWLPADDSTVSYDMTDMSWMTPSEYYQYVLEEPLDISDDIEDDTQTIEFQDRFVRYTAMTMSPQVIDTLIEENELEIVSDLFADPAEAEGEIAFLKAVKRYQQFSEQYSAE